MPPPIPTRKLRTNLHHSPILAWVNDGYPLYGPYGYSNPTNANSGVRRMVSGYALRNGQNGTDNLHCHRTNHHPGLGRPAVRRVLQSIRARPSAPSYPLGNYMEDNDYLGDRGKDPGS